MSITPKAVLKRTGAALPDGTSGYQQRNFVLGVVSGVAYNLYIVVLSTELVMTWFLSELTDSNLLISLLVPIEMGSWYFLQLLLSGYVHRQPRALPLYRSMAVVRVAAVALLALATLILSRPGVLLVVFLLMFALNSVAAGVAALPFLNVVAKTVPSTRRGIYFGWRRFAGGLLGLLGGLLVKAVLSPSSGLAFPDNYALLFFLGLLITVALVGTFSFIVEPADAVNLQRVAFGEQLRRVVRLPVQDRNYRRYLQMRLALVVANYTLPFYAVYARRALSVREDMVGVYLVGATLAGVLSNLVLGRLGDRYGNRLLVRLAAATAAMAPAMALLVVRLPEIGLDKGLLFTLVFVLQGLHTTTSVIGSNTYLLEMAPSIERVLYISFANGIVGLAFFASPLGGAVVDWLGFEPLFFFSLACSLVATFYSMGLREPRQKQIKEAI
jgi:MFS family permease